MNVWKSWRWHMRTYHGFREFWMFGLLEHELMEIHADCFSWCHKPERDNSLQAFISINQMREGLGLNEPRR